MANTAAITASFLKESWAGTHNIDNGGNSIKAGLYYSSGSLSYTTTAYSTTSEVTGSGYVAGGVTATTGAGCLNSSSKTAYWTPTAAFSWSTLTTTNPVDAVLIYNATATSKSVMVATFTAQNPAASNFTLTMPTNDSSTGLMRMAGP